MCHIDGHSKRMSAVGVWGRQDILPLVDYLLLDKQIKRHSSVDIQKIKSLVAEIMSSETVILVIEGTEFRL